MSFTIAIAGKGGTGKTTIAALLTLCLIEQKRNKSILAVDADPNANFGEFLGVAVDSTIGSVLEEIAKDPRAIPPSMPKADYIRYQVLNSLKEYPEFDLLTMGRPEGGGCYCYVNNLLRSTMEGLTKDYDYILIDNEAGFEHLSRKTTRSCDCLLIISDMTAMSLKTARKTFELARQLEIDFKCAYLIINRVSAKIDIDDLKSRFIDLPLKIIGFIPEAKALNEWSKKGLREVFFREAAVREAIGDICRKITAMNLEVVKR